MDPELARVGVVPALGRIEDPRPEAALEEPGDELEPGGQGRVGVAGPGGLVGGQAGHPVAGGVGVQGAPADEAGQAVAGGRVGRRPRGRAPVERQVLDPLQAGGDRPPAPQGHRRAPGSDERRARAFDRVEAPADPAGAVVLLGVEPGGLPDGHALEVRPGRVGVAHARDDRQPARLQELAGVRHRRVEPDPVAHLDQLIGADPERLAMFGVTFIPERDHGVDPVVAAVELDRRPGPGRPSRGSKPGPTGRGSRARWAPGRSGTRSGGRRGGSAWPGPLRGWRSGRSSSDHDDR